MMTSFLKNTLILSVLSTTIALANKEESANFNGTPASDASSNMSAPYGESTGRVLEAERRLASLKALFKPSEGFVNIVNRLNDHNPENSASQKLDDLDLSTFTRDANGISNVYIVSNGMWEVTGTGEKRGESAMNWRDADGQSILSKIINAFRDTKQDIVHVKYDVLIQSPVGGQPIRSQETAVAVSSRYLMGEKNNTGKKFLAFIKVR